MDEFVIDEAAELILADGMKFGETSEGRAVLEMARKHVDAHNEIMIRPQAPSDKLIVRKEDMSVNGRLRVLRQPDGDMCVAIIDDDGNMASVEFCTPGTGGGRSPKTIHALRQLALAIIEDNLADPSMAAER